VCVFATERERHTDTDRGVREVKALSMISGEGGEWMESSLLAFIFYPKFCTQILLFL
jgi:hypothetical protein